jgi:hypothetical protein
MNLNPVGNEECSRARGGPTLRRLSRRSLPIRLAFVGGVTLVAMAIVLPLGWAVSHKPAGITAGAAAAGTCLLATCLALMSTTRLAGPRQLLTKVWLGTALRMVIPLVAALFVKFSGGPLADAGFIYYIVAFYPFTLTSEILVSLPGTDSIN